MSRKDDRSYHAARTADELKRAEEATDPAVAAAHRELAALHRRKMMEIVDDPELDNSGMIRGISPKQAN